MDVNAWLEYRKKGLGASDAPVVMGVSPWKTRFQLYLEKTGENVIDQSNFATRRGHELEPKARASYELEHNLDMPATLVEHPELSFIRASLDGYNETHKIILEIKAPGKEDHALALAGKVPEKYYPQLQHQLLAAKAERAHYYSFDGNHGVVVEVYPDFEYQAKLIKELCAFWKLVQEQTPPELSDKDYVDLIDKNVETFLKEYESLDNQIKELTQKQDELKKQITESLPHPNVKCSKYKVCKITRVGSVDYSKIDVLKDVDLSKFRKKPTSYYKISWSK